MFSCQFISDGSMKWDLFFDDNTGFTRLYAINIANVLRLVKGEFDIIFGSEIVNSNQKLSVYYRPEGPMLLRSKHFIYLSSTKGFYLQHIYQFSHELCHFMIPSKVCLSFRWLEETFCQAMSWYVLRRLFEKRESAPSFELSSLYSTMPSYIQNAMDRRNRIDGIPISLYIAQNFDHLRQNCYDRMMNNTIAYELLPLLENVPQIWTIVPHFCKLTDTMNLKDAFNELSAFARLPISVRSQLIHLLCQ